MPRTANPTSRSNNRASTTASTPNARTAATRAFLPISWRLAPNADYCASQPNSTAENTDGHEAANNHVELRREPSLQTSR